MAGTSTRGRRTKMKLLDSLRTRFRTTTPEPVAQPKPRAPRNTKLIRDLRNESERLRYLLTQALYKVGALEQTLLEREKILAAEIENANQAGRLAQKWEIRAMDAERALQVAELAGMPQNLPAIEDANFVGPVRH